MSTTFEHVILKTELSQSEAFGDLYKELLEENGGAAFNSFLIEDVDELLNNILIKFDSLTEFQKEILSKIFDAFNTIRSSIDPQRLKPFDHCLNEDNELLLYRQTEKGLTNIIINPDDCLAYSFIPNNTDDRKFYFIYEDGDFENLAYDFFSN